MKFKYLATAALVCGAMLQSCDYTDLQPREGFTDQTYWNSVSDLELYCNRLLTALPGASSTHDSNTDNMIPSGQSSYLFNTMTVNNASGWDWGFIRQCNFFMTHYDRIQGNEAEINRYVAEVRFMRSLDYFGKIKDFGDVPWYDTDMQTDSEELLYKARDPRNFVLGKIIEDLQFAIQWLPDKSWGTFGERPHKDAARQQLARVALYYGTYMKYHQEQKNNGWGAEELLTLAAQMSKAVIDSPAKYDIVAADAPANTFKGNMITYTYYDKNKIAQIIPADPKVEGSKPDTLYASYTVDYPVYERPYGNLFIQPNIANNKECVMGRYYDRDQEIYSEIGRQEGGNGVGYTVDFAECYLMKNGLPIYNEGSGYQGDATYTTMMADRDPRMLQTIMNEHQANYLNLDESVSTFGYSSRIQNSAGVTGFPSTKFHSSDITQWNANNTNFNWFIYRYAEALLIYAEATAELNTCTPEILDMTVNKLRDRVGMAHMTMNPVTDAKPAKYPTEVPISNLIYEIRRERRVELAHEGFRMDDLKRWCACNLLENPKTFLGVKATPEMLDLYQASDQRCKLTMGSTIEYEGAQYLNVYGQSLDPAQNGRQWGPKDKRYLYPIPLEQITLNPALTQNPGW